jgi:crotonobetainyl-CoA:carnitine CoA-transferase CaiB-like acyl-CoA transferase
LSNEEASELSDDNGGHLAGTRVLQIPAVGRVPFAAMLLADLGADTARS